MSQMTKDCPEGVTVGSELFKESLLGKLVEKNGSAVDAFNEICSRLKMINA